MVKFDAQTGALCFLISILASNQGLICIDFQNYLKDIFLHQEALLETIKAPEEYADADVVERRFESFLPVN